MWKSIRNLEDRYIEKFMEDGEKINIKSRDNGKMVDNQIRNDHMVNNEIINSRVVNNEIINDNVINNQMNGQRIGERSDDLKTSNVAKQMDRIVGMEQNKQKEPLTNYNTME